MTLYIKNHISKTAINIFLSLIKKPLEKVGSYSTDILALTDIIQNFKTETIENDILLQPTCYGASIMKCFPFSCKPLRDSLHVLFELDA